MRQEWSTLHVFLLVLLTYSEDVSYLAGTHETLHQIYLKYVNNGKSPFPMFWDCVDDMSNLSTKKDTLEQLFQLLDKSSIVKNLSG
jgi:hypothetical protein